MKVMRFELQGDVSRRASALQAEAARLRDRKDMSDEDRLTLLTERCRLVHLLRSVPRLPLLSLSFGAHNLYAMGPWCVDSGE